MHASMNPFQVENPFEMRYRIGGEIDDTEETQEEKIKWKVKLECEQIPKK